MKWTDCIEEESEWRKEEEVQGKDECREAKFQPDDVLESLYKVRIRESDQLKTVLELYDMETHKMVSMPDYQKLKRR